MSNCNKVCVADEKAAIIAANTILQKNKKKVLAMMGNNELLMTRKRLAAFIKTPDSKIGLIVSYADNAKAAEEAAVAYRSKGADTICMSDEVLTGAMKPYKISINNPGGYFSNGDQ